MKRPLSSLDIVAWIGTACVIVGYGLFSLGVFPSALPYHILNFFGSLAVAAISYRRRVWQPFTINAAFAVFALIAVMRIIF